MTKRHHRYLVGLLSPKRQPTITTYGVEPQPILHQEGGKSVLLENPAAVLNNTFQEVRPAIHREAAADDPWLAPEKSETIQALLIHIASAQSYTLTEELPESSWDLRGFCEDAELTERQTEVVVLTGEGWSQRAIAAWLNISQAAVWAHLHHGRHRLAGRLPQVVAIQLGLGVVA